MKARLVISDFMDMNLFKFGIGYNRQKSTQHEFLIPQLFTLHFCFEAIYCDFFGYAIFQWTGSFLVWFEVSQNFLIG